MIGKSLRRKEDGRFLLGQAQFVEDVQLPGMLHVALLRSPYAHARVVRIVKERALAVPGVVAVVAPGDWPELAVPIPDLMEPGSLHNPYCDFNVAPTQLPLSTEITYRGEQVAVVIGESSYAAADGVEALEAEYEARPVVADWEAAIKSDAPRVHRDFPNAIAHLKHELGNVDRAFQAADIVVDERLEIPSLKSIPMECRGIAAQWDPVTRTLNVWATSQIYYMHRDTFARLLDLPYEQVRVIARDVGGGFGPKAPVYPEDIIVAVAAFRLRRPVRWIETRSENLLAQSHSGVQVHDVRVAASRDGTITALDLKIYKDVGAYHHFEMVVPTNTINHLPTQYRIPNLRAEAWCIVTNKSQVTPYRGAGRPEATFTMDRVLDRVALETGLDPLDVRERNIIPSNAMPYKTGLIYRDSVPIVYDGGDYPLMLRIAVERADYKKWRGRQAELRRDGRLVGLGISSYLEAGGIGPCEGATVKVDDTGRVNVFVGVNSQGQGHETTFAQVCAEYLGARFDDVVVTGGDTALIKHGFGTGASRVGVNTGNAVMKAALEVRRKIARLAAHALEANEQDIEVRNGHANVAGSPTRAVTFAQLGGMAYRHPAMKNLGGPGLMATEYFYPRTVTWSSGVHVAVVEVDADTGQLRVLKYVIVHDSGVPLNPMIVDGQVYGGFAQGFGAGVGEQVVYDSRGQLLSGTLMDYMIPRADEVPEIDVEHLVFPTPENPLGVRAVGESGPISPPAVLAAAVEDALEGRVRVTRTPLTPEYVRSLIRGRSL
jgi:carbon-monoxide dehydrogenase large subunit